MRNILSKLLSFFNEKELAVAASCAPGTGGPTEY
jgi:hypothetical protein